MNREDRPDGNVDVDVRRPVQRVIDEHVLPGILLHGNRFVVLFGGKDTDPARLPDHALHDVVRHDVQLLLLLPLDVDVAGAAEDVHEPRPADVPGDVLPCEGHVVKEVGEFSGGFREQPLLLHDEALDRNQARIGHDNLARRELTDACVTAK